MNELLSIATIVFTLCAAVSNAPGYANDLSAPSTHQNRPESSGSVSEGSAVVTGARYVMKGETSNYIEFSADGTFSMLYLGKVFVGNYTVERDRVTYTAPWIPAGRGGARVDGDTIWDDDTSVWVAVASDQTPKSSTAQRPVEVSLQQRVADLEKAVQSLKGELAALRAQTLGSGTTQTPIVSPSGSSPDGVRNRQLSQGSAEKAIRTFASTYPVDFKGGNDGCSLRPQSIASIETVSQFSDSEATTVVALRCRREGGGMLLTFAFQKDINGKWFLMAINQDSRYQVDADYIQAINQNLKVLKTPAQ